MAQSKINVKRTSPQVITTLAEIREWRQSVNGKVGLVPTMGALHEGHATLLQTIRTRCDFSVLSIYINPAQFGPQEDLASYPRTFESDLELAKRECVDVVFAPSSKEVYPNSFSTSVEEGNITQVLCGKFRPGHFRGVATIVLKLFNLIRPNLAFFGLKDAQQFFVIEKMVRDLNLDVSIEGISTVRESDGLALSSRNKYLTGNERLRAPLLYRNLLKAEELFREHDLIHIHFKDQKRNLEENGFRVQYFDCLQLPSFIPLNLTDLSSSLKLETPYLIATASYLGNTRLIDNIIIHPEKLTNFGFCIQTQPLAVSQGS